MEKAAFDTPVSYHVFNRPHITQKTFEAIKTIRPKYLFVTADGPREGFPGDVEKCRDTRKIVEQNITWKCDVYKNYADTNKGSYKCTSDGISWVFNNVEEAIILEDDCLPSRSFFRFCGDLLEKYRLDNRVALISGNNFSPDMKGYENSYYFSRYAHIWGWATWKRTWDLVNLKMIGWSEFRENNGLKFIFSKKRQIDFWDNLFQAMYASTSKQHWDYKLLLSTMMNNSLTILPAVNLVSNIGADEDGTHCKSPGYFHNLIAKNISFPLKHPHNISRLWWADEYTEKMIFSGRKGKIQNFKNRFLYKRSQKKK